MQNQAILHVYFCQHIFLLVRIWRVEADESYQPDRTVVNFLCSTKSLRTYRGPRIYGLLVAILADGIRKPEDAAALLGPYTLRTVASGVQVRATYQGMRRTGVERRDIYMRVGCRVQPPCGVRTPELTAL